jgi:hypothetical protein
MTRGGWRLAIAAITAWLWLATSQPAGARPGNLTSPEELAALAQSAQTGSASAVSARKAIHADATKAWRWGSVSGPFATTVQSGERTCHPASDPGRFDYLKEGAPDAYAKALAYHLRTEPDEDRRRALAAEARDRLLDLLDTEGFHGLGGADWSGANQCILELSISIPVWIETALLLEGTPVWTDADRAAFARWLAGSVYPKVAWASRVRRNNWGAAGSLSASLIARYVEGQSLSLSEVSPSARTIDAATARGAHDDLQLARIGTTWRGDSECPRFGIQADGGIPDELRRGSGGCTATAIPSADDPALSYQTMHVELLVYHAEALRRGGDDRLFAARTASGVPAILQAILFVIDNPDPGKSWPWGTRSGAVRLASGFYGDARLKAAADAATTFRGGRTLPYAAIAPSLPPLAPRPPAKPRLLN